MLDRDGPRDDPPPEPPAELPDDPGRGLATEWLLTNGLGGYAMGTALGANTRRYHGLLVTATRPPLGRLVAVHSVVERLVTGDRVIELSSQMFGDPPVLHPDGWRQFATFDAQPPHVARWTFRAGALRVQRTLTLHRAEPRITLAYEIEGLDAPARLLLRPLTPLRGFHELGHETRGVPAVEADQGTFVVRRNEHALMIELDGATTAAGPDWWHAFSYPEDAARGQDWREDVFSPGELAVAVRPGARSVHVLACAMHEAESPRSARVSVAPPSGRAPLARLRCAADQFVVTRGAGTSIIAGYPWFADWGRDALISLPGLLLAADRAPEARSVLGTFARHLERGLLPNCFDDRVASACYNAADAPLWFVNALAAYARATGDADVDDLVDAARAIVAAYREGTAFGIREDDDGLVTAGDGTVPVSWMDALRGGVTFTPRDGKAIEINALWHHALVALADLLAQRGETNEADALRGAAARTATAIRGRFWWPERDCLHDVLALRDGDWTPTDELRPNQIFAVSLAPSPLTPAQQRSVVDAVARHLLTPFGLRTLERDHPAYRPRYEGDLMERDRAYHNGTVWPWLLGPFAEAVLRVGGDSPAARARVRELLAPLVTELDRGCLGQLAEVYDADAPHRPSGCPAQAWSVAEVLRLLQAAE